MAQAEFVAFSDHTASLGRRATLHSVAGAKSGDRHALAESRRQQTTVRLKAASVAAILAERMAELVRELAGEPSYQGRLEWRFRSRGSLAVVIAGPKRGAWHDHEAGEGGDALALVRHLRGGTMGAAYRWALAWVGLPDVGESRPSPRLAMALAVPGREAPRPATLDLAQATWTEAGPAAGTVAESYLALRGVRLEPAAPLRFHPQAWRNPRFGPPGPAMVALMSDPATGAPCGVHVTYLRADGTGKAEGERPKIMLGAAGCVRLVTDAEVTLGLGIAEGIETSLSVMQGGHWYPVWAATSAGAVARFPVLHGIEALTVFADPDQAGADAARRCAERWSNAGREARIYTPRRGDFNDMVWEHTP